MALLGIALAAAVLLVWAVSGRRGALARRPELYRCRYAHRGLHDAAAGVPENSLPAFRRAAAAGFGAELDVHLTRDGRLAVFHDSRLERICGAAGTLEERTAAELSALRLCGTGERIPMLEEVLPLFAGGLPLLIEMKPRNWRDCAPLAEALARALAEHRGPFCVQSFHPWAMRCFRRQMPGCIRGQLARDFRKDREVHPAGAFLLSHLLLNWLSRPDFIAYRFEDRRTWGLRLCRRLGLREFSWTITDAAAMTEAEADGATPIFEGFSPREPLA